MKNPTLTDSIAILENYFSKFNERYFENELSKPVITIAPDTTKKSLGWCTTWKAWKDSDNKGDGYFEINICSDSLNRSIDEVCETLLHEMVHLYNLENGIKDCSRSGTYHNTNFRDAAIAHGLNADKDLRYGWTITSLTDETREYIAQSFGDLSFPLYRTGKNETPTQNSSSRKYVCPMCGCIIRATREVHIICGECEVPYKLEKK